MQTNKWIILTPGFGGVAQSSISQVDFKWYASGVGTNIFIPSVADLRTTIYNWYSSSGTTLEPGILFGGVGTLSGTQYFSGPYQDYSGSFSGVTTTPYIQLYPLSGRLYANGFYGSGYNLTNLNVANFGTGIIGSAFISGPYTNISQVGTLGFLNVTGITTLGELYLNGPFYDSNSFPGTSGQILTSTGSGIAWSSTNSLGIVTGTGANNEIVFWKNQNTISGISTFVYTGIGSVGIGTTNPTQFLQVQGNVRIIGGIYDSNNNIGLAGSVLYSTGTGIAWSGITAGGGGTGNLSGSISTGQIAFGSATSGITGIGTFVYYGIGSVGIGTANPTQSLHVQNNFRLGGFLFDNTNSSGNTGNILSSVSQGVAWSSINSLGIITGSISANQVAFGLGNSSLQGNNSLWFTGSNLGIGTSIPSQTLHVVGGFRLFGSLYDSLNSPGAAGQVLGSIGTGIGWTTAGGGGSGNISGALVANEITYATNSNTITGNTNFVYYNSNVGIGTATPSQSLTVQGNSYVSGLSTATTFFGSGTGLTNLQSASLVGNIPSALVQGSYSGITSVGTLSQLYVNGLATATTFFGSGLGLTNLQSTSLVGNIPTALIQGSYSGITSVGTLSQLYVNGLTTATTFFGSGLGLTNLQSTSLIGNVPTALVQGSYSGITSVGTLSQLYVNGLATATTFFGSGLGLTNLQSASLVGNISSTLIQGNYSGITSVGTLSQLYVNGLATATTFFGSGLGLTNLQSASLVGNISSTLIQGNYSGITSVGTLSQLYVNGLATALGHFGPGTGLTNLQSASLVGNISSTLIQGNYSGITSVGTLSQLYVNGLATATTFFGSGLGLTNLQSTSLVGNIPSALVQGSYSGITSVGTLSQMYVGGLATATTFFGSGLGLTNLQSTSLIGNVPTVLVQGSYSGITSVGTLSQLYISGISTLNSVYIKGSLYDSNLITGSSGNILSSTGSGIAWSSIGQLGVVTGAISLSQVAFGAGTGTLQGSNNFWFNGINVGIGTNNPISRLNVRSAALGSSIVRIEGFSGTVAEYFDSTTGTVFSQANTSGIPIFYITDGTNSLPTINIQAPVGLTSQIVSVVSSSLVSYFSIGNNGYVGIGTSSPSQLLQVQGNVRITGGLYDSSNNIGFAGSVLSSTGSGLAWTAPPVSTGSGGTGTIGGQIALSQVAFGGGVNSITGNNSLWFTGSNLGIGTSAPTQTLHVVGGFRLFGSLYDSLNSPGANGQVLGSIGTGIGWTTAGGGGSGNISGALVANEITYATNSNTITGNTNFVYYNSNVGIGTATPQYPLSVYGGDAIINNLTVGLGSAQIPTNLAFGFGALINNASFGTNNLAIGYRALGLNTSGINNLGIGLSALATNSIGNYNIGIGYSALGLSTNGIGHIAIGYNALGAYFLDTNYNAPIPNIAIGFNALQKLTVGAGNVGLGLNALSAVTSGTYNMAIGGNALSGNNFSNNVGIGYNAGQSAGNGASNNTLVGYAAGQYLSANASGNVALGYQAIRGQGVAGAAGTSNIAIGQYANIYNTSGSNNVSIGAWAGAIVNTGSYNIFIGGFSSGLTSGSYQIALGYAVTANGNNQGVWGGNLSTTYTNLGLGSFIPGGRLHIETLGVTTGLYISGSGSTSYNLIQIDASTFGTNYITVTGFGSLGIGLTNPTQSLHIVGNTRHVGGIYDSNNNIGLVNNILTSTGTGISWSSTLNVSSAIFSGIITASSFYGSGIGLTGLLSSALVGNIPSALVQGSYSGITSVGTLSQLYVNGLATATTFFGSGLGLTNLQSTSLIGNMPSALVQGSYSGITSVGTLSQLYVGGLATALGYFGPGTGLTNLQSASLVGNIPSALVQGNYSGITSIGTLSQLYVNGLATATTFFGSGLGLTNLQSTSLVGNVPSAIIQGSYSGITSIGTISQLYVNGLATATTFFGSGLGLTNLQSTSLVGNVPSAIIQGSYSGITSIGTISQLYVNGLATALGHFGPGTGLTNLQSASLVGNIPPALVQGSYSGITSVGTLSQLYVGGITTVNALNIKSTLYDANSNNGSSGQVLTSLSNGVAWSSVNTVGIITGNILANQIAFGAGNSSIQGTSVLVYVGSNLGIGTTSPKGALDIQGSYVFNVKTLGLTTSNVGILTVNMSNDSSAYLKITAHGNLNGYGPLGYVADFILQKGDATLYSQPGIILNQYNNTYGGVYVNATINDPGVGTGNTNITISLGLSTGSLTSLITYELRGQFNTVI